MDDNVPGPDKVSPLAETMPTFAEQVGAKATRKLRKRGNPNADVWFGLGMMGLVGWSVAVPTLLGAALGIWLDSHYPGQHSWTLALLVLGLTIGCFNAWHWVAKEDQAMHDDQVRDDREQDDV
ncbi:F0F1 ATP synthase subunit [Pseudolysobacter antarcticus]|uniref:F0F1 ATP synthase subunit n=1 Tax=Pseudolysobacter antarcticus TaxID=2511995 RepID=A0A411HKV6_9GAMM|nr:AtpZ/AtpI family protein [Pseudolysobacter antarcticus]QBB71159.1 F0F1 ATP synthase subunit [Pseudolysobacter antarcticus]